jgi:hypothetical protein
MHVLGKQERPFLRAGWTEVEGFARKGTEVLELAFRIGAWFHPMGWMRATPLE